MMASKSKEFKMKKNKNPLKKIIFWATVIFLLKIFIIFKIDAGNAGAGDLIFYIDGIWLGADGENYLTGYELLRRDGIFSAEAILNYWPAGYPLVMLFLSLLGTKFMLTMLSIIQSLIFSIAVSFFVYQITKTKLKSFSNLVLFMILLNPTLSLSSIAVGYESLSASGFMIITGLVLKDLIEKDNKKLLRSLCFTSLIFSFLSFMQPRFLFTALLVICFWLLIRLRTKFGVVLAVASLILTLLFPLSLVYRNLKATSALSISTNLGVTMAIGSGPEASGGYKKRTMDVPCKTFGTAVEKDQQLVRCIVSWYFKNPSESARLFANKSIFFWSPWTGPLANGTMARNPWVNFSPAIETAKASTEGYKLVTGVVGQVISWLWLLGGLALLFYGLFILFRHKGVERLLGIVISLVIGSNWVVSLITIGDHRFRLPIMGVSLFVQAIAARSLALSSSPRKIISGVKG